MSNKNEQDSAMGPQGTQVFDVDSVNEMIAAEIAESQSANATTPALIGISNNVSGQKVILNKSKMEVGRRPNSDLVINDSSVSAMHAQIIESDGGWKVLNLLSSNGTFVNGEKVAEQMLNRGDRVAFAGAEYVFTYVDDVPTKKKSNGKAGLLIIGAALVAAFACVLYLLL